MKSNNHFTRAALALLALLAIVFSGCEVGSPNTVIRGVAVDYSGFYRSVVGAIPSQQSGAPVENMNLIQTGDNLQAIDNNGAIWKGRISNSPDAQNLIAQFTMEGKTTAGSKVTMAGNLSKDSAGATTARMDGTWIEPTFYATFSAIGQVSATSTNSGSTFAISPPSATVAVGGSAAFSVSGGTGTITWSVSGSGNLSTSTGNSTTFTRNAAGAVTLTANDTSGHSATATIN